MPILHGVIVPFLEEEPSAIAVGTPDQHESALELLPGEFEVQFALRVLGERIRSAPAGAGVDRIGPGIPNHHLPRPVLPVADGSLEGQVFDGMILRLHRQAAVLGIEGRALGHGEGLEHAAHFQAQIEMEPRGVMLVHDESASRARMQVSRRLGRLREIPLLAVAGQGGSYHSGYPAWAKASFSRSKVSTMSSCDGPFPGCGHPDSS